MDVDGKGNYTSVDTIDIDDLSALWRAGLQLYSRNLVDKPRTIYTQTDNANLLGFTTSNNTTLQPFLGVADAAAATKTINYVYGFDTPSDTTLRSRSVTYQGVTPSATTGVGVWKLGDIINSTPKIQSGKPLNGYHLDYDDSSYRVFINSTDYVRNTMVYAGANDGMLHAFRLGQTTPLTSTTGTLIARLTNPGSSPPALGSEAWAFIPKNALPYLKYLTDPNYSHLYYVDNTPLLVDASINKPDSCAAADYWDCPKITTAPSGSLTLNETSWRSVLVGSMGLGGASRPENVSCNTITGTLPDSLDNCVNTPLAASGYESLGLSSYFAFDVTNSATPSLLWEFSDPDLGYSTVEPVIVRMNGKKGSGPNPNDPDPTKNGRWFLVFGSGPTGPIETTSHQFYARSDQNLKIFIVDLKTGQLVRKIDSGVNFAFSGSLTTNGINVDKKASNSDRFYETEVVYIGYVKPDSTASPKTWTDGGILRLMTNGDTDPANWTLTTLIDGVGPVTASIDKMYDDKDKNVTPSSVIPVPSLWLFFGSGRFYYKNGAAGIDSATNQMQLYGLKEPCYSVTNIGGVWTKDLSKHLNTACTADTSFSQLTKSMLTNQSSDTPATTLPAGTNTGWYINLDDDTTTYAAERLITTPDARTNGMVVFTTFKPTAGVCGFGGETFFWFTDYRTGGPPPLGTLTGKIVIQLSTGAIIVIDLSQIKPPTNDPNPPPSPYPPLERGGRQLDVGAGKPPTPKPAADSLKVPVKKVLQIQEK
jgi:type IV pilus assembly protein PilY1